MLSYQYLNNMKTLFPIYFTGMIVCRQSTRKRENELWSSQTDFAVDDMLGRKPPTGTPRIDVAVKDNWIHDEHSLGSWSHYGHVVDLM